MQPKKQKKLTRPKVSQKVQQIREGQGLTQQSLAEICGLTAPAIVQIEKGDRKPSFDTLIALAQGLGVSLDFLVGLPTASQTSNTRTGTLYEKISRMPPAVREDVSTYADYVWEKRMRKKSRKKKKRG